MTKKNKNSMIFRFEWRKVLTALNDAHHAAVFKAIIDYAEYGTTPDDPIIRAAIALICSDIDRDKEVYAETCERNARNGEKGGRPTTKNPKNPQKPTKTHKNPKNPDSDSDNDVNSPKVELTVDNPTNVVLSSSLNNNPTNVVLLPKEKKTIESTNVASTSFGAKDAVVEVVPDEQVEVVDEEKAAVDDVEKFQHFFNSELDKADASIPRIRSLTDKRKAVLRARLREHGKEALGEMIRKAAASDFLNGGGNNGFVANFDWLMRPNNFPKVLEGTYDNRTNNPNTQPYGTTNSQTAKVQRYTDFAHFTYNKLTGNIPEPGDEHDRR